MIPNTVSPTNTVAWMNWLMAVERMVGHSLDGHIMLDGFSYEDAVPYFMRGDEPEVYATVVEAAKNLRVF